MMVFLVTLFAAAALSAAPVTNPSAGLWAEDYVADVGQLPATASFVSLDFLQQIQGYLNAGDVDMYRFRIRYPTQFSATTTDTTGLVGAVNDTILTLFYTDGFPIAKNDDISAVNLLSTLPALNSLYALLAPGDYLLAVSIYNNLPLTGASAIWTSENFVGVFPPDFPGNVTGWTNEAVTTGSYRITLTGADRFSDCPNVPPPQLPIPILFPAP